MELLGFLTFVSDLQTINPTSNSQFGDEPLVVREVIVHTFVPSAKDGVVVPYLRSVPLRMLGRQAQSFNIAPGATVALEYGCSARPYHDSRDDKWRVSGNLTISRICEIQDADMASIQKIMANYPQH